MSAIELVPITRDNFEAILSLAVAPCQQSWVGTSAEALVYHHFNPSETPLGIRLVGGRFVGFAMYRLDAAVFNLSRLFIDSNFQRRGYGAQALDALIALAHQANVTHVHVHVHQNATTARNLYQSRGFSFASDGTDHFHGVLAVASVST
jgi:GNAT superfamily N-acetyltransferase